MKNPKTNFLNIFLIIFAFVLFISGAYYLGKQSTVIPVSNPVGVLPKITATPTQTAIRDPIEDWKKYLITPDTSLGLVEYQVKLPSSWTRLTHSSNFQNTETFQDQVKNNIYKLIIDQRPNFDQRTGNPYETLTQYVDTPYGFDTTTVNGITAAKVLPRAGSESIYKVIFLSHRNSLMWSIELQTPIDGIKMAEGEEIFTQILSTLKFVNSISTCSTQQLGITVVLPNDQWYCQATNQDWVKLTSQIFDIEISNAGRGPYCGDEPDSTNSCKVTPFYSNKIIDLKLYSASGIDGEIWGSIKKSTTWISIKYHNMDKKKLTVTERQELIKLLNLISTPI